MKARPISLCLLTFLFVAQATQACGLDAVDPPNDQDPSSLPNSYDLVGLKLSSTSQNVSWSWLMASLDNSSSSIQLWGGFSTDASDATFHPDCVFNSANFALGQVPRCSLSRGTSSCYEAGCPVTFETLLDLVPTLSGGMLTLTFPIETLGPVQSLQAIFASVELAVAQPDLVEGMGGSITPVVTDSMDLGELVMSAGEACEIEELPDAEAPKSDDAASRNAIPSLGPMAILAMLGIVTLATRRRRMF